MRNVNNKNDKTFAPLKFSDNLLTFSWVLEENVVPKIIFLEKNSIKYINKCTRKPSAHFYNYENLRNSRQGYTNKFLKIKTHFILEKQVYTIMGHKNGTIVKRRNFRD